MRRSEMHPVERAIAHSADASDKPLLLAVSGGLDSIALLHGTHRVRPARICAVATFDHGTGEAAARAAAHVHQAGTLLGLKVVTGRSVAPLHLADGREAAWRTARHAFLSSESARLGAAIVTAHTEDDQLETVLMRVLRGAGARGLAGLYAPSAIFRPLIGLRRMVLADYARDRGLTWVEDPSNASMEFLRNRVRHQLLPALTASDPQFGDDLLAFAHKAARLRLDVDKVAAQVFSPALDCEGRLRLTIAKLPAMERDSLGMLLMAAVAHAGVVLDRRGATRISGFVSNGPRRGMVPLAGGWTFRAEDGDYIVEREASSPAPAAAILPARGTMEWGRFRFRAVRDGDAGSPWHVSLPLHGTVRVWEDGDRLLPSRGQPMRRVKRYLSDARIRGRDRRGWPVVVAGEDVVWIPGVRRSDAATDRSGRPVRHYICERIDR